MTYSRLDLPGAEGARHEVPAVARHWNAIPSNLRPALIEFGGGSFDGDHDASSVPAPFADVSRLPLASPPAQCVGEAKATRVGVWELDLLNETEYWSRDCFEILGSTSFQGSLATLRARLETQDADRLMEAIAQALEDKRPFDVELSFRCERHDLRSVSIRGECIHDAADRPTRIIGSLRECSGNRPEGSAVTESETRLRETIDQLLEGCQILDADLRYVYLNPNACRHGRRTFDELIGKRILDAFPGFEQTPLYAAIMRSLTEHVPCEMQSQFTFSDGTQGIFDLRILPASDGVVILSNEVTERKRAEESLRHSEVMLETAQRMAGMGVWDWDLKDDLWWSDELYQIFGRDPESFQISFPAFLEQLPLGTREQFDEVFEASVQSGGPFQLQHRIVRPDGVERWVDAYGIFERGADQRPRRMWGVCVDITDRIRAEAVCQKQLAVLEQIAAGLPLRTVLNAVVDLVEGQFPDTIGSIHLVNAKENQLQFAAGKNLPAEYVKAVEKLPIGPLAGSCGTAAFTGKPVYAAEIATDPHWNGHSHVPLQFGLRSCCSVPIVTSPENAADDGAGKVLGTFALYRLAPGIPAGDIKSVLASAVHLARLAIDRDQSDHIIRDSEARFAAISEVTRCVTFGLRVRHDRKPVIEWARPHFGMLSGYSEEDINRLGYEVLFHPEDMPRVRQFFQDVVAAKAQRQEFRYITRSGKALTVLIHGKVLETGPLPGECLVVGGLLDITEMKATEVALRSSQERFQLALRGANDGLWDWNLRSNQIFLSPRWKSMLGYGDAQIASSLESWFRLLHPEDNANLKRQLQQFLNGPTDNFESEFRMRHQSGAHRNILCRGFLLRNARGRPVRMVGTHQDITERKRSDEELRASRQRLEALSRQLITTRESELRHLSRELHDEIGQELTMMKLSIRDIQRGADEATRGRLNENLAMIDRAICQVRNLSLNMRPPHLDELGLVATLHWYLKQQAKIAGIEEVLRICPGGMQVPAELAIICFRITQEAVTNAVRHSGGRLIEVELRQTDDEFFLTIRDDGQGFDVDRARQGAAEGASLGIIGMQERAHLVGGRTEIRSVIGAGTTVCASFPLARFGVDEKIGEEGA